MDADIAKRLVFASLGTLGLYYYFKQRKLGARCRRSTADLLSGQGMEISDAISRAEQYCGDAPFFGGEELADETP
jgi:hypothetical protein